MIIVTPYFTKNHFQHNINFLGFYLNILFISIRFPRLENTPVKCADQSFLIKFVYSDRLSLSLSAELWTIWMWCWVFCRCFLRWLARTDGRAFRSPASWGSWRVGAAVWRWTPAVRPLRTPPRTVRKRSLHVPAWCHCVSSQSEEASAVCVCAVLQPSAGINTNYTHTNLPLLYIVFMCITCIMHLLILMSYQLETFTSCKSTHHTHLKSHAVFCFVGKLNTLVSVKGTLFMDSLSLCQGVCRRDWMSGRWRDVQVVSVVMELQSPPRPPGSSLCCGTGSYTNESRTTAAPSLVFTTFTPRECWPGSARHTEAHCRVCVQSVWSDERRDGTSLEQKKDFRPLGWCSSEELSWDEGRTLKFLVFFWSWFYCDECISVHYIVLWFYTLSWFYTSVCLNVSPSVLGLLKWTEWF